MQVVLIVTSKMSGESTRCDLILHEAIVIGRHMESPVVLQGEELSRRHLSLSLEGDALSVQDLSSNGTWLNGIQLRPQSTVRLRPSDILEIPGYELRVRQATAHKAQAPDLPSSAPKWIQASRAKAGILEPREMLLFGCILAAVILLVAVLSD